jgi:parvulin-like peptidyl-prolyl isomerase
MLILTNYKAILTITTCICLLLVSCKKIEKNPEVFIQIGDLSVSYEEFNNSFDGYIHDLKQEYLQDYIHNLMIDIKGNESGLVAKDDEVQKYSKFYEEQVIDMPLDKYLKSSGMTMDQWHEKIKKDLTREKVVQKEVYDKIKILPSEIQTYYDENKDDYFYPKKYHLFQILTFSNEEAKNIKKKLKSPKNYKSLAKEFSKSPEATSGGDLGILPLTDLPIPAQEELQCLDVDEVSDIIHTSLGYHIFMIKKIIPSGYKPLSEEKEKITQLLLKIKKDEALKSWFTQLEKEMKLQIYTWN